MFHSRFFIHHAAADTQDESYSLRHLSIGRPAHFTTQEAFQLQVRHDIRVETKRIFFKWRGIDLLKSSTGNNCAHIEFDSLLLLIKINGVALADFLANPADAFGQVQTVILVDKIRSGNSLLKWHKDRFPRIQSCLELARNLDWANLLTLPTSYAPRSIHKSRLHLDQDSIVSRGPLHRDWFCHGNDHNLWMLPHIHHSRRENALGAVKGWKGLAELSHVTANARRLLHQVYLITLVRQLE